MLPTPRRDKTFFIESASSRSSVRTHHSRPRGLSLLSSTLGEKLVGDSLDTKSLVTVIADSSEHDSEDETRAHSENEHDNSKDETRAQPSAQCDSCSLAGSLLSHTVLRHP
mgnify:CR=1 FL=1